MYSALGFSSQNISIVVLVSICFLIPQNSILSKLLYKGSLLVKDAQNYSKGLWLRAQFCIGTEECLFNQLQHPQYSTTSGCSVVHTTDHSTCRQSWSDVHQLHAHSLVSGCTSPAQEQSCVLENPPHSTYFFYLHPLAGCWQSA